MDHWLPIDLDNVILYYVKKSQFKINEVLLRIGAWVTTGLAFIHPIQQTFVIDPIIFIYLFFLIKYCYLQLYFDFRDHGGNLRELTTESEGDSRDNT